MAKNAKAAVKVDKIEGMASKWFVYWKGTKVNVKRMKWPDSYSSTKQKRLSSLER